MQLGKPGINRLKFTTEGVAALPENFYKIHKLKKNRKHDYRQYKIFIRSHHLPLLFRGELITAIQLKST